MIQRLKQLKQFPIHSLVFLLSTLAMIGLGVAGFCVPPVGIIDPSVFQFASLLCVPLCISQVKPLLQEAKSLHHMKASVGKMTIETENDDNPPEPIS